MIRLIASDVDGTLLQGSSREIPEALFPLIRRLRANGILFAACSGRQYANLRNLFAPVADEIGYICENGSLVVWENEIIVQDNVEPHKAHALLRKILTLPDCEALLSGVHTSYTQPKDPAFVTYLREHVGNVTTVVPDLCAVQDDYIKLSLYRKSGVDHALAKEFTEFAPYLTPVIGRGSWMDFLRENCGKGTAMDSLCAHLGIAVQDTAAFGDNENDLPLVGHTGCLYAMEQGDRQLIEKADRTTDNVITAIEAMIENKEILC